MFSTNPNTSTINHVFPPHSNSFLDHEKDDFFINHPHFRSNPFLSGDSFPASENSTAIKNDLLVDVLGLEQSYDNYLFSPVVNIMKNSKTADHHSKIHTSKGPRDRRVRLSIEVAKKFFCLQDLLGFDKASKTLDWLFTNSKISIDELITRKKQISSSSSSVITDQSQVIFMETGPDEQPKGRKKKYDNGNEKKLTRKYKSGLNQLRTDARARARERTKEKLNIKKLDYNNESNSTVLVECCSSNLTCQSSFWNSVELQNDYSDKIGPESIMEDNISMLYSYQHNQLVVSNESSTCLPLLTDHVRLQSGDYATI